MCDNVTVAIRNTFLHLIHDKQLQDDEQSQKSRSNSAPPSCRHAKLGSVECESEPSTRCLTFCGVDESASQVSTYECGSTSPRTIVDDDEYLNDAQSSLSQDQEPVPANAQSQIDMISDKVMNVWAQLRALEVAASAGECSQCSPAPQSHVVWMPVQLPTQCPPAGIGGVQLPPDAAHAQRSGRTPLKALKLDKKTPLFTPTCKAFGGTQDIFTSVKQLLMLVSGVASVDVQFPTEGALASISIKLDPSVSNIDNVLLAAKGAFLEAAANSRTTYVLGYEAEPFKDLNDSTFMAMLASLPVAWERTACWETYQVGVCPRGKSCKWQHPGKREMQPVRVSVS